MFNINLEEAELELKESSEDVLDYTKDLNIFEALDSVQTTLDIMVCKEASYSIMEGSLILESKLLNTIMNEEDDKEKKKGWFKKTIDAIVNFIKRICKSISQKFKRKKVVNEALAAKVDTQMKKYLEEYKDDEESTLKLKSLIKYTFSIHTASTMSRENITKFALGDIKKRMDKKKLEKLSEDEIKELTIKSKKWTDIIDKLNTANIDRTNKFYNDLLTESFIKKCLASDGIYDEKSDSYCRVHKQKHYDISKTFDRLFVINRCIHFYDDADGRYYANLIKEICKL